MKIGGAPVRRVRVKVCGITRTEDALAAAALGVDAIGFVFYPKSSRLIDPDNAASISSQLPPFLTTVGLFLDASAAHVQAVLQRVPLDLLQFHGDETAEFCAQFERPYIKAVPMRVQSDVRHFAEEFATARALLLDSHGGGVIGGSGNSFDWSRIPKELSKPLILAGGLHPGNVAMAVTAVRPYGLDVSSGVERSKGIKDPELIRQFVENVPTNELQGTNDV